MHSPDFAALKTFVTVVESGTLSRAAQRLETTAGAVSRRIAALEQNVAMMRAIVQQAREAQEAAAAQA